ncbi:MAG: hypothetical protein HY826_12910 [Actinobacteria bacterium]|nr:hypothetical protein [Actinomycetota bacterium]
MGIFKQMKDMKDVVHAAPGLIEQSQEMAANAQVMQQQMMAQQQAAMQQAMGQPAAAVAAQPGGLDPIAGVDLQKYAKIVKAIAPMNYDQTLLPGIAAANGVDAGSWQQAHDGWNARIKADPGVAAAFSAAYQVA